MVVAAHHRPRMSLVVPVHHRPAPAPYSGWSRGTSPVWRIFPSPLCRMRSPPGVVVEAAVTVPPPSWSVRRRLLDRDVAGATLLPSQMR